MIGVAAVGLTLLGAHAALAVTPGQKCEAGKLKELATFANCRTVANIKAVKTAVAPDFSKCGRTTFKNWQKLETKALGYCPTKGDVYARVADVIADTTRTSWRVSSGSRFFDNSDGTITDNQTGLMWEKKVGQLPPGFWGGVDPHYPSNPHGVSGRCQSSTGPLCQPNGAAGALCAANDQGDVADCGGCADGGGCGAYTDTMWNWLANLNSAEFAGYRDWRLPTRQELEGLLDLTDSTSLMVDVAFDGLGCDATCLNLNSPACSCPTFAALSATADALHPHSWWRVNFYDGTVVSDLYGDSSIPTGHVRAVRSIGATPPTWPPLAPGQKRVFVTSVALPGGVAGLAGADGACTVLAGRAGLDGTFKAWLSDSSTTAAARLTHNAAPYVLVDGTVVAQDWGDLTDGDLQHAIDLDETGATHDGLVWTATDPDGGANAAEAGTCGDWKFSGLVSANTGSSIDRIEWTQFDTTSCATPAAFYCFEQ